MCRVDSGKNCSGKVKSPTPVRKVPSAISQENRVVKAANVKETWAGLVLVEVMRERFGLGDKQGLHAFGFDGDDVVLILQNAFDGKESLAAKQ